MLPFDMRLVAGKPASEQLIAAVHRALAAGQLRPGDEFPSVRKISLELGINPNTAQKAVASLVRDGHLEVHPGRGTRVVAPKPESAASRTRQLSSAVSELIVFAKRIGATPEELEQMLRNEWKKLNRSGGG